MGKACFIDSFSVGLDELPRKKQRDARSVLAVLAEKGRFSVFEATANDDIARTMDWITRRSGWVSDLGGQFPWTNIEVTDAGRAALNGGSHAE